MGRRIAKGSQDWYNAMDSVDTSDALAEQKRAEARIEDVRIDGPRGYGSQLRPWLGGR